MSYRAVSIGAFSAICLCLLSSSAVAQVSRLYLATWDTNEAFIVQGGTVVGSFARASNDDGPGFTVTTSIKMIGQDSGDTGNQYDLSGNLLGGSYTNPAFSSLYDGATDGLGRSWSIGHNDFNTNFAVLSGDMNWGGLGVAFIPANRSSGITYDGTDDSLWITNTTGTADKVQHFSTGGTLLGEFAISVDGGYAIALDTADQTLWVVASFTSGPNLFQFDKTGNFLQSLTVAGLQGKNPLGAEFAVDPVPEPATMAALGMGLAWFARRRGNRA